MRQYLFVVCMIIICAYLFCGEILLDTVGGLPCIVALVGMIYDKYGKFLDEICEREEE